MPSSGILVALDFSATASRAAEVAAHIGRRRGAHLVLLHVDRIPEVIAQTRLRTAADVWETLTRDRIASARQLLGDLALALGKGVDVDVQVRIAIAPAEVDEAIVDSAERGGHRLVVLGPHRPVAIFPRPSRASVPFEVARQAPCPVLIVCERRARIADEGFRRPLIAATARQGIDEIASVGALVSADEARLELATESSADQLLDRARRDQHDLLVASRRSPSETAIAMRLIESSDVSLAVVP